jgi:hypothetical protein
LLVLIVLCVYSQSSCGRDPIIYMCYGSYPSSRIASSDSEPANGIKNGTAAIDSAQDEKDLQEIRRVLTLLHDWTFTHPRIVQASPYHLNETRHEMKMWILGHLIQAQDSHRLAHQSTYLPFKSPTSYFYHWVSHGSADHTSVGYSALCSDASLSILNCL